nr:carboxylesterase COEC6 [Dendroctonus rhizophagus]
MSQSEGPIAITPDGQLRGATEENIDGQSFLKFLGIRYGKPPVENLRFQPPQPVDPWEGVKEATNVGNSSISRDEMTFKIEGDEDCLYLNVYTHQLPGESAKLRPVMFYIHGGGFVWGSSRPGIHGPKFLMTKDVVVVTINYRLGILGFLSVDGTDVTGNMGLKDQNLALKWVQRNIASFNGDPNNVTIFGESAGSAAVHAHVLSPASKGLFHKAILQSGTALNFWFWGSKNNARYIVELLGKSAETEEEALDILKQTPALEIYNAQEKLKDLTQSNVVRPISPVVEPHGKMAFLTEYPRDIIKNGTYNQVPIVFGYTDREGYILDFMLAWLKEKRKPLELEKALPFELNVKPGSEELKKVVPLVGQFYSEKKYDDYDIISDSWFLAGIIEAAEKHLETSKDPVYLYRMSICSNLNYFKAKTRPLDSPGASHADDLGYLWHMEVTPTFEPGSLEDRYMRIFVDLWTNFAQFANPTVDDSLGVSWRPLERKKELQVLDIGQPLEVKPIPESDRINLWRQIYKSNFSQ